MHLADGAAKRVEYLFIVSQQKKIFLVKVESQEGRHDISFKASPVIIDNT